LGYWVLPKIWLLGSLPVISQIFVDECNGHASLGDGRRNSLNGTQPNVATSENTWDTRFKQVGIAAM